MKTAFGEQSHVYALKILIPKSGQFSQTLQDMSFSLAKTPTGAALYTAKAKSRWRIAILTN